jgi:hypothetical protein
MSGRNGTDHLSRACSLAACALAILAILGSKNWLSYLWYPSFALYFYAMFRMFSRNLYQRQQENNRYLDKTQGLRRWFGMKKMQFQQRKDYAFFACPNCKTTVRVPKGKGTVNITCPKCREKFTRKS